MKGTVESADIAGLCRGDLGEAGVAAFADFCLSAFAADAGLVGGGERG